MKKRTQLKAGEFVLWGTGEYSSYGIDAVSRVLKDFDAEEVVADFKVRRESGAPPPTRFVTTGEFLSYLVQAGYIEDLPRHEINLDYDIESLKDRWH